MEKLGLKNWDDSEPGFSPEGATGIASWLRLLFYNILQEYDQWSIRNQYAHNQTKTGNNPVGQAYGKEGSCLKYQWENSHEAE